METRTDAEVDLAQRLYRRWLSVALVVALIAIVSVVVWRKRHARHRHGHRPGVAAAVIAPATVQQPSTPAPSGLALELWIKSPEALASKLVPRLMPGAPMQAMVPSFAQIVKNGMPPSSQKSVDEIDFHQPLGYAVLDDDPSLPPPPDGGGRFVLAATVKDPTRAQSAVLEYAQAEGATPERSAALNVDTYRGAKTGRYLALVGNQVMLGSDRKALEDAAPRLAAALTIAKVQTHDVVARAPQSWIAGPFAKSIEQYWLAWSAPQLGGATDGPAKGLFDSIAKAARETWPGAEDLEVLVDVGDQAATATATLRVHEGSPLSKFLGEFPVGDALGIGDAPRDALGAIDLHFPQSWVEVVHKFVVTPPPGQESMIPPDLRAKAESVYNAVAGAVEGDLMIANVVDPPPNGGPGGSLYRLKIRDVARAKQAAHEFLAFMVDNAIPPGGPTPQKTPLETEGGGVGEAVELSPPPAPAGQPPMPVVGFAWVVRGDYAYVATGTTPKARVLRFASTKDDDHLGADKTMGARLGKLPGRGALYVLTAPFRPDTPIAQAVGIEPIEQAITLSVVPSPKGVIAIADLDLDLAVQVLGPMLMRPPGGPGGPGGPGAPPGGPGSMMVPPPGGPRPTGKPVAPPPGGAVKPPQVVVPPAPTGYVLPLPKHTTGE